MPAGENKSEHVVIRASPGEVAALEQIRKRLQADNISDAVRYAINKLGERQADTAMGRGLVANIEHLERSIARLCAISEAKEVATEGELANINHVAEMLRILVGGLLEVTIPPTEPAAPRSAEVEMATAESA